MDWVIAIADTSRCFPARSLKQMSDAPGLKPKMAVSLLKPKVYFETRTFRAIPSKTQNDMMDRLMGHFTMA